MINDEGYKDTFSEKYIDKVSLQNKHISQQRCKEYQLRLNMGKTDGPVGVWDIYYAWVLEKYFIN